MELHNVVSLRVKNPPGEDVLDSAKVPYVQIWALYDKKNKSLVTTMPDSPCGLVGLVIALSIDTVVYMTMS